ncbi:dihydrodipicolinate reductase [Brevibacillus sp. SYP-B805]|uniref:4-hydroxy-tetrahydrodipicolinate reductase n=1 Tax=Brevibacillus sp. SYP-B805 TaxID=1578199 RepID=UPI0013EAD598|nr:dihydrodipicolinate reductase C-terminal domain-containing protein [Brevibacillus sp. SYP-B805]NGQ95140.1 dihydrodipicolinate reductase [Brevibacillus sp. SYP-B805]
MRIGLIGFGKTGKEVAAEVLKDPSCTLEWVLRKSEGDHGRFASQVLGFAGERGQIFSAASLDVARFLISHPVDVILDFSTPEFLDHYGHACRQGIKIVSAISNYDEWQLSKLRKWGQVSALLHSPNITLGINILMEASKLLQQILPQADIEIVEEHFREKKEVSGTAVRIARNLGLEEERHINSIRVGGVVGRHEVIFGLPNQTIRLVHESINRSAFGQGAIYAAKWLVNKSKGLYTMEQVLSFRNLQHDSYASRL